MQPFLTPFRAFINSAGRSVLFTSLFYALWLVISCVSSQSFDLHAFPNRMIGTATLEAYDVGARVALFYKAIGILLLALPFFNALAYFIYRKLPALFASAEAKIINATSVAGIILFLFQVFYYRIAESIELIYFVHKLMLAGLLLRLVFFRKNTLSVYQYAFLISVSVALYFFVIDCFNLAGALKNPDVYLVTFIIACIALILFNLFLQNKTKNTNALLYTLLPLTFLPAVSFLKDELFLVLKRNDVIFQSPLALFIALVMALTALIFHRSKKAKTKLLLSEKELISRAYFPWMIFSLLSYTFYSVYMEYSDEMFEYGNVYLPVMELKLFGVIPTFEKLNSHLVSDYFFSAIYTFFNGMQGREMQLYDFLIAPITFTLYYYLVLYLSRNAFVALFSVLLFPFAWFLMPAGFCYCVLAIFALNNLLKPEQSLKKYIGFFASIVGLVLWRIDMGYTCMVVMPLIVLFYHVSSSRFKISWPLFIKGFVIVIGIVLALVAMLSAYRHINLFSKALYALNYFSSAQTYGYITLGWNTPPYWMHYFVFPALVGLILLALLLNFKALTISKNQRVAYLAMLFSCAFYFINFNRGLIRHSLIEWTDTFTSAYIYITIPAAVFVFPGKRARLVNAILFFLIAFFMIVNYRVNVPTAEESKSMFERLVEKSKAAENIDLSTVTKRVIPNPETEAKLKPVIDFIAANTTKDQTFIDFTNNPMLFYFTQKITPSYFYQNPGCSHNEFLQDKFIADLKNYDAPYLIYASSDPRGFDQVDEVPNSLRHYRMAEYFHTHYAPYIMAGKYSVWKRNDVAGHNKRDTIYRYQKSPDSTGVALKVNITIKPGKHYLAKIITAKKTNPELGLTGNAAVTPTLMQVADTVAYALIEATGNCTVELKNNDNAVTAFYIIECDHLPDLSAERFLTYPFRQLPYIWGSYDKNVKQERVLFEANREATLETNIPYEFDVPANLDRTSGNTVLITCKNSSAKIQRLRLSFGDAKAQKTNIDFDVPPAADFETQAIRISSIYKWYGAKPNHVRISAAEDNTIRVKSIRITKGS